MPELSNLLRQRLAATQSGAAPVHPDADTLTGFVEQSLPVAERETVMIHLSVCEPCREVVALSRPELSELATQTVLKPAPVSRWRRLLTPTFGLAATVAAMALIAALVLQLPQKSGPPATQGNQQAKAVPPAEQRAPVEAKEQPPAGPAETSAPPALADRVGPRKDAASEPMRGASAGIVSGVVAPPPPPPSSQPAKAPVLAARAQKQDYVNTNFFANSNDNVAVDGLSGSEFPSAPQPQPAATKSIFIANKDKVTGFSDIPASADSKSNVLILTPAPPPQHLGCTVCKIATATAHTLHLHTPAISPAIRSGSLSTSAMGGLGTFSATLNKSQPSEVSAAPEKAESSGLAGSDALSPRALSSRFRSESAPTVWKVAGGKLIKSTGPSQWEDAYPATSNSIEFSVVNARGNDVWAGGSHASLIHSRDAGLTWEIIKLGDAATGTIVSITPGGPLSVQVKTSDNQTWSSTDGGKSWTLRND